MATSRRSGSGRTSRTHTEDPDEGREPRGRRPKKSGGSAVAALGIVGCVVVIVLVGLMFGKGRQGDPTPPAKPEVVDPFAGLPDEVPKPRSGGGASAFGGTYDSDAPGWVAAREAKQRADAVHEQMKALQLEGDATWRVRGEEAFDLYAEALELGGAWRAEVLRLAGGPTPDLDKIDRTLQKWRSSLMGLRKVVG